MITASRRRSARNRAHEPFFVEIARRANDSSWKPIAAALTVLRMTEAWWDGEPIEDWGIARIRDDITALDAKPYGEVLSAITNAIAVADRREVAEVGQLIYQLGRQLEFDALWPLAINLYRTIGRRAARDRSVLALHCLFRTAYAMLATERRAAAERNFGRLRVLATRWNSAEAVVLAELGAGAIEYHRGNFPLAETILQNTNQLARRYGFRSLQSRALHDLATLSSHRRDHETAIRLGYRALQLCDEAAARDRILVAIGSSFYFLRMFEPARQAYVAAARGAQEATIRWTAMVNLIDLVGIARRDRAQFETLVRSFSAAPLPPRIAAGFQTTLGEAWLGFGEESRGRDAFARALAIAVEHGFNDQIFEIEAAKARAEARSQVADETILTDTLRPVADLMRELADAVVDRRAALTS